MPEQATLKRARRDARQGKAPSTQAGEFVREEIHHIREGKHGARNSRQAIAIGLSKARRAGVPLAPPAKGRASAATRRKARQDLKKADQPRKQSRRRSRRQLQTLRHEGRRAASSGALARQARRSSRRRGAANRSRAATKAARTRQRRARSGTNRRSR